MGKSMKFQYINDSEVSESLDKALRQLLSTCFVKNQDAQIFSKQRYYNEMPQHRYLLWQHAQLVAHIAVHEKEVIINNNPISICGIAEVCVHPEYRNQGFVKHLLEKIHLDRIKQGDGFSVLFGDEEVYGSSGYRYVNNLKALNPSLEWTVAEHTMVLSLNKDWPTGEVKLSGIPF